MDANADTNEQVACTHCWHQSRPAMVTGFGRLEWQEYCCWCGEIRRMEQDQGPMPGHGDHAPQVPIGEPRPYVEREWVPVGIGNLVQERPKSAGQEP